MQKHIVKKIVTDSCIEHYTLSFQKELYTYENLCGAYNIIGVDIKYMNTCMDFNSHVLIVCGPQDKSLEKELSKFGVLKVVKDIRHYVETKKIGQMLFDICYKWRGTCEYSYQIV